MSQKYSSRQRTAARAVIITVALILVVAISFTFAWFSGRFTNEGNLFQAADPNAPIELSLIAQSPVEDPDNPNSLIWPALAAANVPAQDNLLTFADEAEAQEKLGNVVLSNKAYPNGFQYQIGTAAAEAVRFLNEKDWLPASRVTKRLIVQGANIQRAVDYNISFDILGYNDLLDKDKYGSAVAQEILAEALEVTVYEVSLSGSDEVKTVVEGFDGIGAEELVRKNLHGVLSGGVNSSVTYEVEIQLAETASYIYSKNIFNLNIQFESYSEVGKTYYVANADELLQTLEKLENYDNIVLRAPEKDGKREIVVEDFITDKLFNLRLDDTDLKVTRSFAVTVPDEWGTIDLGMYGSAELGDDGSLTNPAPSGMLVLPYNGDSSDLTSPVILNAPRAAVRYGKIAQFDENGDIQTANGTDIRYLDNDALRKMFVNVRAVNGAQDLKSDTRTVGAIVEFGKRQWLVVDINDAGNVTLLYHDPEPVKPLRFTTKEYTDQSRNDWATSDVRSILNDESNYGSLAAGDEKFMRDFLGIDDELKSLILPVTNKVEAYGNHGAVEPGNNPDGRKDSLDYVWLPSVSQIGGYNLDQPGKDNVGDTPYFNQQGLFALKETHLRSDGLIISDPAGGEQWAFFEGATEQAVYDNIMAFATYDNQDKLVQLRSPSFAYYVMNWTLGTAYSDIVDFTMKSASMEFANGVVPALTLKSWQGVTVLS